MTSLSPDHLEVFELLGFPITLTVFNTWLVMIVVLCVCLISILSLRQSRLSRRQHFLEIIVEQLRSQIKEIAGISPDRFLPLIGTLFVFLLVSNLLGAVLGSFGFSSPTESLSTAVALALVVFMAVPYFGLRERGVARYLRSYIEPTVFMLPFNIFGELSRTLALAVRLFGNMMSGALIASILLSLAPLFVPVVAQAMGVLTGVIQAYIFAVLAMVYIASAMKSH